MSRMGTHQIQWTISFARRFGICSIDRMILNYDNLSKLLFFVVYLQRDCGGIGRRYRAKWCTRARVSAMKYNTTMQVRVLPVTLNKQKPIDMKNSELIEKLEKLPKDLDVVLCDCDNDEFENALLYDITGVDVEIGIDNNINKITRVIFVNFSTGK